MDEIEVLRQQKDTAYSERNQLVAALSKCFPAWLARHEESDTAWEDDWRWIVFIELPIRTAYGDKRTLLPEDMQYQPMQVSWHIHDSELPMFAHLPRRENTWDGHTTEEKYRRLAALYVRKQGKV